MHLIFFNKVTSCGYNFFLIAEETVVHIKI